MIKINSALFKQFHQHGLSINKGVAIASRGGEIELVSIALAVDLIARPPPPASRA